MAYLAYNTQTLPSQSISIVSLQVLLGCLFQFDALTAGVHRFWCCTAELTAFIASLCGGGTLLCCCCCCSICSRQRDQLVDDDDDQKPQKIVIDVLKEQFVCCGGDCCCSAVFCPVCTTMFMNAANAVSPVMFTRFRML